MPLLADPHARRQQCVIEHYGVRPGWGRGEVSRTFGVGTVIAVGREAERLGLNPALGLFARR